MPHFRRSPSHRRAARPTASWLVTGPTIASQIQYGHRTTYMQPVKASHHRRRYHEGQRLSLKGYVGGSTLAHLIVTGAERIQLGHVDYGLVRELGYVRVDAFQEAWVAEHEPDFDGEPLERFQRRHAHREMWVIRFALDRTLPDRYMAQNSEEGYTESTARGLKDEPPALHPHEWKQHVEANRDLTHEQWLALGRLDNIAARAQARAERGRNMRRRAA
jgi:hypothetical protein